MEAGRACADANAKRRRWMLVFPPDLGLGAPSARGDHLPLAAPDAGVTPIVPVVPLVPVDPVAPVAFLQLASVLANSMTAIA